MENNFVIFQKIPQTRLQQQDHLNLTFASFQAFKRQKEEDRQSKFLPGKKKKVQQPVQVRSYYALVA